MKKKILVGIIGGTGKMGQWFKRFFEKNGCKVVISGRKTKLTPEECARICDVVIITVPITATIDMIKRVAPLVREDSVLMDLTSLKKEPVRAMIKYSKSEVIGTHPVFGPSVSSIQDQTVVLCPGRGVRWLSWLKKMLARNGAKIKVSTPEKHDKMMSIIQGMMHFGSISICHALKELGVDIYDSQKYSSPIYKLRMDMVGRILNQDPELYANIEIQNPETVKTLGAYLRNAKQLYKIIKRKDTNLFIRFFKEASDYLGGFKKEAEEYSNYLIDRLVERKKK